MKTIRSTSWPIATLALALLAGAGPADAAVGTRVLLQEWSPLAPEKQPVRVLANDPSAVSDAVQAAWSELRPRICQQLRDAMGKGGAAAGQTLTIHRCLLDQAATLSVTSTGPNALSAALAVSGYVDATSTTPTILDRDVDPRFSVALTARLLLAISVQPNRDLTVRVDKAQFKLTDATIDSHNLSGDLLKFVAEDLIPYFHGPNYRQLAESAIDSIAIDLAGRFNAAMAPVNAKLRGPSGAVRVGVWGKPDAIVVAFGPRELAPTIGGTMSGVMRWEASKITPPGTCEFFHINASVQTGPAPLRDPGGYYEPGDAPRRDLGSFQMTQATVGAPCTYRLSNIAVGWPNAVKAVSTIAANKNAGNSIHSTHYSLVPDGWDGRTVLPQPTIERNYVIRGVIEASAVLDPAATLKHGPVNPGDPRTQALDRLATETLRPRAPAALIGAGKVVTPAKASTSFSTRATSADAVSLNPQPLPPDPPPDLPLPASKTAIRPAAR